MGYNTESNLIEIHRAEFMKLCEKHIAREGCEDLLGYLDTTDFFVSPASTKFHLAISGGLCLHSLNVYKELNCLNTLNGMNISDESIAISALFHDICKVNVYKQFVKNRKTYEPSEIAASGQYVRRDAMGEFVWVSEWGYIFEDNVPFGHGEKSVWMINKHMRLTDDEAFAIRYHMGFNGQYANDNAVSKVYDNNPLAIALHLADLSATYCLESTWRNNRNNDE